MNRNLDSVTAEQQIEQRGGYKQDSNMQKKLCCNPESAWTRLWPEMSDWMNKK